MAGKRKPWWWLLVPYPFAAADGNRLQFAWIRLSDAVIVAAMCATTFGIVYALCRAGELPVAWVSGGGVVLAIGWGLSFLLLAGAAFLFWQPYYLGELPWRSDAALAAVCAAVAGIGYAIFGRGHDDYMKGMLVYVPLGTAYLALWSIPRAIWRGSRSRSPKPPSA